MSVSQAVPANHPMMRAWERYKSTEVFANVRHWAVNAEHVDGSLWAAFVEGWKTATDHAAGLPCAICGFKYEGTLK
jgi:hypothetical protein